MKNVLKLSSLCLVLFALFGCGEDAYKGSTAAPVDPGTGGGGVDTIPTPTITSIRLGAGANSIGSGATETVDLTATVRGDGGRLLSGIAVVFTADNDGSVDMGGAAAVATNTSGVAKAKLTTFGNPQNRNVTVTASAGVESASKVIAVIGSTVSVSGESSLVLGSSTDLAIFVKDSNGDALSDVVVTVTSRNTLSSATATTSASGQAKITLTGSAAGQDTVIVSGVGTTASHTLNVSQDVFNFVTPDPATVPELFVGQAHPIELNWAINNTPVNGETASIFSTRGILAATNLTVTNGVASTTITGTAVGPMVITAHGNIANGPTAVLKADFVVDPATASKLDVKAERTNIGANGEQTLISATVRDNNNNLVKNKEVTFRFIKEDTAGSLSNGTAVTNSSGSASTVYTSTSQTSAKDGIVIEAKIAGADCVVTPDQCDQVALTVADNDLFFVFGLANKIEVVDSSTYKYNVEVLVTNSAGNPSANTNVSLVLEMQSYDIGFFWWNDVVSEWWTSPFPVTRCVNEDFDRNGTLESNSEDLNRNGILEPRNVASIPQTVTTNAEGFADFYISYSKRYSEWVDVKITATVSVSGTESKGKVSFSLPISASDATSETDRPNVVSPWYGATIIQPWYDGATTSIQLDPNDTSATPQMTTFLLPAHSTCFLDYNFVVEGVAVHPNGVANQATVRWAALEGATNYTVHRSSTESNYTTETTTQSTGTTITDTFTGSGTFYYVVTATANGQETGPSIEVEYINP